MANFVCIKSCFTGTLCRPGDVVDEVMAAKVPECFKKLRSTKFSTMQAEIEDLVPELAEERNHAIKPLTSSDIRTKLPPVAGME